MTTARIVFAGTPDFAVPTLESIVTASLNLVCVFTQPDRKQGRGQKLTQPAVKRCARAHGLHVRQIHRFDRHELEKIRAMDIDLMIVVAFGIILPRELLDIPRLGCVNVHGSLLPRWRGAAPVHRAIEAGDHQTGVTIMQMDEGVDTGPVLSQVSCPIKASDSSATLQSKLAYMGAQELSRMLPRILNQEVHPAEQNEANVTYAAKLTRNESEIDWSMSAQAIVNKIRALNPWPVAHTWIGSERIQIWDAKIDETSVKDASPGEVLNAGKRKVVVAAGDGVVSLREVQKVGKKRLPIAAFVNGFKIPSGSKFGAKPY